MRSMKIMKAFFKIKALKIPEKNGVNKKNKVITFLRKVYNRCVPPFLF